MTAKSRSTARAFTLIETMMAVTLLSMITVFAMPMYREATARSYRLLVIDRLRETAWDLAWETRGPADTLHDAWRGETVAPDEGIAKSGRNASGTANGLVGVYRVIVTRDAFGEPTVRATPIAGGPMHNDPCASYTLGSNGVRRSIDAAGRRLPYDREQACWRGRG